MCWWLNQRTSALVSRTHFILLPPHPPPMHNPSRGWFSTVSQTLSKTSRLATPKGYQSHRESRSRSPVGLSIRDRKMNITSEGVPTSRCDRARLDETSAEQYPTLPPGNITAERPGNMLTFKREDSNPFHDFVSSPPRSQNRWRYAACSIISESVILPPPQLHQTPPLPCE